MSIEIRRKCLMKQKMRKISWHYPFVETIALFWSWPTWEQWDRIQLEEPLRVYKFFFGIFNLITYLNTVIQGKCLYKKCPIFTKPQGNELKCVWRPSSQSPTNLWDPLGNTRTILKTLWAMLKLSRPLSGTCPRFCCVAEWTWQIWHEKAVSQQETRCAR